MSEMFERLRNSAELPNRRQFVGWMGAGGLISMSGCGGGGEGPIDVGPPVIQVQPQGRSVRVGDSVALRVEATGGNLLYQWKRNGADMPGATGSSLEWVASAADMSAVYSVVVRNSLGRVESQPVRIDVMSLGAAGISVLAGAIGGDGYLLESGTRARLPVGADVARGNTRDGMYLSYLQSLMRVSANAQLTATPIVEGFAMLRVTNSKGELFGSHGIGVGGAFFKLKDAADGAGKRWQFFAGNQHTSDSGWVDGVGDAARFMITVGGGYSDGRGNIYVIDSGVVRKIDAQARVTSLAPRLGSTVPAADQAYRELYVVEDGTVYARNQKEWHVIGTDGTVLAPAELKNWMAYGVGHIVRSLSGDLYAIGGGDVLVRVALDGAVSAVKDWETGQDLVVPSPNIVHGGMSLTPGGNLCIATRNCLYEIDLARPRSTPWLGTPEHKGFVDGPGATARFEGDSVEMCSDAQGNVYVLERTQSRVRKITPEGKVTTVQTDFPHDGSIAIDAQGYFYGVLGRAIYRVSPSGEKELWAGGASLGYADGVGVQASFASPYGLAFDLDGNLFVGDRPERRGDTLRYGNTIRRIAPSRRVTTVWGTAGLTIPTTDKGSPLSSAPALFSPQRLAFDGVGTLWCTDEYHTNPSVTVSRIDLARGQLLRSVQLPTEMRVGGLVAGASGAYVAGRIYQGGGSIAPYYGTEILHLGQDGSTRTVAGSGEVGACGVVLGSLPGRLNHVGGMAMGAGGMLCVFSENTVLGIRLE